MFYECIYACMVDWLNGLNVELEMCIELLSKVWDSPLKEKCDHNFDPLW